MASVGIIPVPDETKATSSRRTKEGRKITYSMEVIQQPERARACGSGAKSSADRRPVDPPPIVQLHVYEGENAENDITFQYNANFFLYATLESARPIAQGRVAPTPSQPSFPVLTGSPVAGTAYLDRPKQAGYFIFPDLSVRHEGKYRLSFTLYEELKEAKDLDAETSHNVEIQKSAHVTHRLQVRSLPFTVFSAKKFPGLSESTSLSKMVAEQGCRVRIRRDVRMRRRGTKGNHEYDEYEQDEYQRNRNSATPEHFSKQHPGSTPQVPDMDRPRSVSNASQASHMTGRRPSMEQIGQAYQQPAQQYAPHTPQGGMYPPQMTPHWQQPPPPANFGMQPPQHYPQQGYQPPTPQYSTFATPQYPSYDQQNSHMRHNSVEYPAPPTGPPPPIPTSQPMAYPNSSQPMQSYGQMDPYNRQMHAPLQPLQTSMPGSMHGQYQSGPVQSPMSAKHDSISPYQQAPHAPQQHPDAHYYGNGMGGVAPPKFQVAPQPTGASKRTYEATFDGGYNDQRLQGGARPPSSPMESRYAVSVDGVDEEPQTPLEEPAMSYRRADGTERRRNLPNFN